MNSAQKPSSFRHSPKLVMLSVQKRKAQRLQHNQVRRAKTPALWVLYNYISINRPQHIPSLLCYTHPTTPFIHSEDLLPIPALTPRVLIIKSSSFAISRPQVLPLARSFSRSPKPNIISCQSSSIYCLELANVSYI